MILCILGRQPELGLAELEALYPGKVRRFGKEVALVDIASLDVQMLGGTQKASVVRHEFPHTDWQTISRWLITTYRAEALQDDSRLTLGFSAYAPMVTPTHLYRMTSTLKANVKQAGSAVRIIPNTGRTLNTATSHHNKLGLGPRKKEVLIVQHGTRTLIAESTGAQNISALARRDQGRPKRDAFVGMLPPKLALMMVNIGLGMARQPRKAAVLDPFCGTGVVLQEAYLRGATVYGTDLSDKMIDFSQQNLAWLQRTHTHATGKIGDITQGDATSHRWPYATELSAVVCETYLGQPFSATPSPSKLRQVRGNCNAIIGDFLRNIQPQLAAGIPLCVAVPAWRDLSSGVITRLPLVRELAKYGYQLHNDAPLLYYRDDQVVARDILLLTTVKKRS